MEEDSPVKISQNITSLCVKSYNCLICGRRSGNETLRKPGEKGICTFIDALETRGNCNGFNLQDYDTVFDFENKKLREGENNVRWHPKCYSTFTNATNLKYLGSNEPGMQHQELTRTRSQKPLIDLQKCCMFCGFQKHKNDTKLLLLQYENVISKIKKACEDKGDDEFRRKIGGSFDDLPALDARYHLKCYVRYIYQETQNHQPSVHDDAFKLLCVWIDLKLAEGRAIELVNLLSKFQNILEEKGYENYNAYTTQKLKQRLVKQYGSYVKFTESNSSPQAMYSSSISISDVINVAANYKQLTKDKELMTVEENEEKLISRVADVMIDEIRDVDGISTNPLDPRDITAEKVDSIVPRKLKYFLTKVCTEKTEKMKKVLSVAQDIISLSSNGRKKMPKQVGLAISLKSSERSKNFIRCLNNLGHCISYDDVQRIETSWAEGLIEEGEGYATIPSNIVKGSFVQAAFDNADYGQAEASQHVTNTVLYQCQNGNFGSQTSKIPYSKSRRRSACISTEDLEIITNCNKVELPKHYSNIILDFERDFSKELSESKAVTEGWTLLRNVSMKLFSYQVVPDWTGFRKIVSVKVSFPTTIGNCRTVPASPTDVNVVYSVMLNVNKMLTTLEQEDPCVTVDESIYQIAKQIQWRVPALQNLTVRLGGFHRAKNFLGVIGKRMKSTGFSEILEESELYGPAQIDGILDARHYYRGIKAHTVMVEAMLRLYWEEFEKWLKNEGYDYRMDALNIYLEELCSEFDTEALEKVNVREKHQNLQTALNDLKPLLLHFNMMAKSNNEVFQFWLEYCHMVLLLLDFIASERDSEWNIHLETFQEMIYYDRAFDHYKYFSWGLIYLSDMAELPTKHPALYESFQNGQHTVSRSISKSSFNCVSTDMALEQSLNKDSKSKGGIVGFTQDLNAVEKWTLTAHLRTAVHSNFQDLCFKSSTQTDKHFLRATVASSEKAVTKVYEAILKIGNPFVMCSNEHTPLKNIFSGHVVKEEHRGDILNSRAVGKASTEQFFKERIKEQTVSFHDPIKKMKLHTFTSENKKLKVSRRSEPVIILKDHQQLFSKLLTVSRSRQIDLKGVLSHELTAVPLALFHPTGEMRKTNKSQLMKELEAVTTSNETLPTDLKDKSATVVDFMALVQSLNKSGLQTFDQLANRLQSSVQSNFKESNTLVIVPDRYDIDDSIKSDERARRQSSSEVAVIDINRGSLRLPKNLQLYLSNSRNKENLIKFLFEKWKLTMLKSLESHQTIYLANLDGTTLRITSERANLTELVSDHEEADSKMFVYCSFALNEYVLQRIIICSPDTDVAVICCYQYFVNLSVEQLWFKTGVGKALRYVPMHEVASSLGPSICKLMPAFHAVTGCDSVSSLCGIGKKSAFNVLKTNVNELMDMQFFGESPILSLDDDSVVSCIRFVCMMYDKSTEYDINELRFKLFSRKGISSEKLPPTLEALTLHLRRANYQCHIWKSSCTPLLSLPGPDCNGWIKTEHGLEHDKMITDAVPDAIIELIRCTCRKGCKTNICCCRKANLACTDACLCEDGEACQNCEAMIESSDDDDDDI